MEDAVARWLPRWLPQREAVTEILKHGRRCAFMYDNQRVCCAKVAQPTSWKCDTHPTFWNADSEALAKGCDLAWVQIDRHKASVRTLLTTWFPIVIVSLVDSYIETIDFSHIFSTQHIEAWSHNMFSFYQDRTRDEGARGRTLTI